MEINLLKVNPQLNVDEDITIDLTKFHYSDLKDLKNLHVQGKIFFNSSDLLEVNLHLTGVMVLIDSISLKDIPKPIDIQIEEEYDLNTDFFQEYYKKEQNILDIIPILWENIVLEVPISYTQEKNVNLSGEGWQFTDLKKEEIDPRMAKLQELLNQGKE